MIKILLLSLVLIGCAAHTAKTSFLMPERAPLERVPVYMVDKDGICPGDGFFYMSEEAFKNLQRNIINTESYLQQLENLLRSFEQ